MARKPRDIDAELKTLQEKAKALKAKRALQLGELVVATGADALDAEVLAGVLLTAIEDAKTRDAQEAWRRKGVGFFQRRQARKPQSKPESRGESPAPSHGGDAAS